MNVDYNPGKFPGLVLRMKRPKTAILIFGSGKMICAGAKSAKMAKCAVRTAVKTLKAEGFIINRNPDIIIENVVSTANLGGEVDLEAVAAEMDNLMYEPEQFPGLIYRMKEPKVVMLIFASGKLVCTGAKHEDMVKDAVFKLHGILEEDELIYYD